MIFLVQFGNKWARAILLVFQKFTRAYLFQIGFSDLAEARGSSSHFSEL